MLRNLFFWIFLLLVLTSFLKNQTNLLDIPSKSENLDKVQKVAPQEIIPVEPLKLPLRLEPILMDPLKKLID